MTIMKSMSRSHEAIFIPKMDDGFDSNFAKLCFEFMFLMG